MIRDCVRYEWHGKKVSFSARPFSKLINDFEQIRCRGPRERAHHRDKLHRGFGHTDEMSRNRSHRSPPAHSNDTTIVGLEPFT